MKLLLGAHIASPTCAVEVLSRVCGRCVCLMCVNVVWSWCLCVVWCLWCVVVVWFGVESVVCGVCGTNDSRHGESVLARAYYASNWVAEHLGASSRRPRHPFPALMAGATPGRVPVHTAQKKGSHQTTNSTCGAAQQGHRPP